MKCLYKYQWVKLQRNYLPEGKGILGYWAKLAACAAYRKGTALYCGYENAVGPGMWSGGVTGIKSILGVKSRSTALQVLQELSELRIPGLSSGSEDKEAYVTDCRLGNELLGRRLYKRKCIRYHRLWIFVYVP